MTNRRLFPLALTVALCAAALTAALIVTGSAYALSSPRYVATTGQDDGNCTDSGDPCQTVQYAVDAALEGDTIMVATGVYTGVNNRGGLAQMVYLSKGATIAGGYPAGFGALPDPDATPSILDAQGGGRVLYIVGPIEVTIEGLSITGGNRCVIAAERS